jgi:hypothetical protein
MAKKCPLAVIALIFYISIFSSCIPNPGVKNLPGRVIQQNLPYTAIVFHDENNVCAMNSTGQIFAGTQRGQSVADVFQQAVDMCRNGGEVKIKAGEYRLDKSIVVDYPCTISGEGRGTILVPPVNEFALRVKRTERSPVLSDWVWGTKREQIPKGLYDTCAKRLYGVHVRSLAIIGYGHGKGIYLNELTECCFADLWIHVTNDGSALYINSTVMESEFQNIHCYNNGSVNNKEATIIIASQQEGDSSNNLHFDKVYVLLPAYIGVEIGTDAGKYHPRLIYFSQSFFHGWWPEKFLAPYDQIYIRNCDPQRGVTITDSRFTLPGKSKSSVHLGENTIAQIANCTFGYTLGEEDLIRADSNSTLIAANNIFHSLSGSGSTAIRAEKANTIIENNVFFAEPNSIYIEQPKSSVVQGNIFSK